MMMFMRIFWTLQSTGIIETSTITNMFDNQVIVALSDDEDEDEQQQHLETNTIRAQYIVEKVPENKNALFGISLQVVVEREQSFVPDIVSDTIELIRSHLHKTSVGAIDLILKSHTTGVANLAKVYRDTYYDKGYTPNLSQIVRTNTSFGVSGLSWLLFDYLKSLPSPLLVYEKPIIELSLSNKGDAEKREELAFLLSQLPAENFLTFKVVIDLIHEIIESKKSNTLDIDTISGLFAPILFKQSLDTTSTLQFILKCYPKMKRELEDIASLARYNRMRLFQIEKLNAKQLLQYMTETVHMIELYYEKFQESTLYRNEYELREQGFNGDGDDKNRSPDLIILVRQLFCKFLLQIFKINLWMIGYYQPFHVLQSLHTSFKSFVTQFVGYVDQEHTPEPSLSRIQSIRELDRQSSSKKQCDKALQFISVFETVNTHIELLLSSTTTRTYDDKFISFLIICINKRILSSVLETILVSEQAKVLNGSYWATAPVRDANYVQELLDLVRRMDPIKITFIPFPPQVE
jgi:hypothetical protein